MIKKSDDILFFFSALVVFERCFWSEDPGSSWGSHHLLCSRGGARVLALQRDGVSHVHGEVAGVKPTLLQHIHTHTCSLQQTALLWWKLFQDVLSFLLLKFSVCFPRSFFLCRSENVFKTCTVFYDPTTVTFLTGGLHYFRGVTMY